MSADTLAEYARTSLGRHEVERAQVYATLAVYLQLGELTELIRPMFTPQAVVPPRPDETHYPLLLPTP